MRRLLLVAGAVAIAAVVGVCALSSAPAPRGWSVPPSDTVPLGDAMPGGGPAGAADATGTGATGADPSTASGTTAAGAGPAVGNASRVSRAWAADVARRTGIPERAVLAYAGAATAIAVADPGCRLGWSTLAGLGAVESHHGTIGGSAPQPDGTVQPPILGPRLDGTDYDAIHDTDGGRLDGDPQWDRAVGPFQFIPSTWEQWGADGSGDGIADPQQLDDAALAAARYLCSYGDLSQPAAWREAIFAYNHLDSYVDAVAAAANAAATSARGASGR
ncbi:lytic murein transglycosylase [Leifsonia sp. 71-9]|uniref:lytic murein transglycosylase n=1 Tax=Leifsonia sp. 71-9 TaxID=1895934 RepID=UPI000A9A157A|nr:lytic murein transglycosylase [Leifsonia sp. 71-9]